MVKVGDVKEALDEAIINRSRFGGENDDVFVGAGRPSDLVLAIGQLWHDGRTAAHAGTDVPGRGLLTDMAVMFSTMVSGTVPTSVQAGLLKSRLAGDQHYSRDRKAT